MTGFLHKTFTTTINLFDVSTGKKKRKTFGFNVKGAPDKALRAIYSRQCNQISK